MDRLFYNKVIKQGNSLCVRIPYKICKKMKIDEGTIVAVELVNIDEETKKLPDELVLSYKKILPEFSIKEIRKFLNNKAIESSIGENIRINKKYEKFKELLENKKIKSSIKKEIKKTKYWDRYGK